MSTTPCYRLTFTCGTTRIEIALFPGGALLLGRDAAADVRVIDAFAGLQHALIEHTTEGPVVVDLGSRNGTYVNGFGIERCARPAPAPPLESERIRERRRALVEDLIAEADAVVIKQRARLRTVEAGIADPSHVTASQIRGWVREAEGHAAALREELARVEAGR